MIGPVLAVGVGNTTVKLGMTAKLDSTGWPSWDMRQDVATSEFDPLVLAEALPDASINWRVASVHRPAEQSLADWVRTRRPHDSYLRLDHTLFPIRVHVDAPDRVGLDRLAAAVAANHLREANRAAIVIDAGTALTVNLISPDGGFQGGVILPGFALTAKALQMGTDRLPFVAADMNAEPPPVVGKSTEEAIRSGLFWGSVGSVSEIIRRIERDLDDPPQLFVTGGDARRLAGYVSRDTRYVPDLVLAGIVFSTVHGTTAGQSTPNRSA